MSFSIKMGYSSPQVICEQIFHDLKNSVYINKTCGNYFKDLFFHRMLRNKDYYDLNDVIKAMYNCHPQKKKIMKMAKSARII